jgi:hypothetical protein
VLVIRALLATLILIALFFAGAVQEALCHANVSCAEAQRPGFFAFGAAFALGLVVGARCCSPVFTISRMNFSNRGHASGTSSISARPLVVVFLCLWGKRIALGDAIAVAWRMAELGCIASRGRTAR